MKPCISQQVTITQNPKPMQTAEQLEFRVLLEMLQPVVRELQATRSVRHRIDKQSPDQFAVVLLRATAEEQVAFATYAVMVAVRRHVDPPALARVAVETGYSYHAVTKLVDRCLWLERVDGVPLKSLRLTEAGDVKLERINRRIARYV